MKREMLFVYNYSKRYKIKMFIYFILCILLSIQSMIKPLINGSFIDFLIYKSKNSVYIYVVILCLVVLSEIIIGYYIQKLSFFLQNNINYAMNMDIIKQVLSAPYAFIYKKNSVYLNELISKEVNTITSFSINVINDILKNIILMLISIILITSKLKWGVVVLIALLPLYYIIYIKNKKILFYENTRINEENNVFGAKLYSLLANGKFIKINNVLGFFEKRVEKSFRQLQNNSWKYKKICYRYNINETLLSTISSIFMLIYMGKMILMGKLTIGEYTVINTYYGMLCSSVKYFFTLGQKIQETKASYNRLDNLKRLKSQKTGEVDLDNIEHICLEDISFSFFDTVVYKNIKYDFYSGKVYVIIGDNGSGKTTLANTILGLYNDEMEGNIYFNNVNIKELNMEHIRERQFSISEQEPFLCEDTLYNNIVLDRENISIKKLNELLNQFNLIDYVNKLPYGINTRLYENGINLSGGEKQKISMVRTFLKEAQVVILDEPTNAMDIATKNNLKEYIKMVKKGKIIIIITHDEDMIAIADKIIKLR